MSAKPGQKGCLSGQLCRILCMCRAKSGFSASPVAYVRFPPCVSGEFRVSVCVDTLVSITRSAQGVTAGQTPAPAPIGPGLMGFLL